MERNSLSDSCTENDPEVQFYEGFCESRNSPINRSDSGKTYMSNFLSTIKNSSSSKNAGNTVSSCKCCSVY
ncbi:hypothetical protein SteCoe_13317 [Stentor coeruleus]|uniref:Uncharacterized protein n=1 Tax=Stentor coeruleus TaxID=5963 RepID=A0A1R2C8M2_9CILI|nr:hypothetical protein SteCoe_13317 [Stentor coeruleus]